MFKEELKDNCIYNDAHIEGVSSEIIRDFFRDELERYVAYFVHEFDFQESEVTCSEFEDMDSGHLFTIFFKKYEIKFDFFYDTLILDDSGDTSFLAVKCDGFRCKISEYQSGEAVYNEDTELYEPIAENEKYSYLENAIKKTVDFLKEEVSFCY